VRVGSERFTREVGLKLTVWSTRYAARPSGAGAELAKVIAAPLRWHAMFQTHISTVETNCAAYPGLELLATAVVLLTDELGISYVNPAAENLFELSKRQLVGQPASAVFGEAPALFQAIDKALASGASYTEQELELCIGGKLKLHLSCTVSAVEASAATMLLEFRHIDQQLKIAREERLLEQQQSNRDLIRSLAHEIKNPLRHPGARAAARTRARSPALIEWHAGHHRRSDFGCRRWSTGFDALTGCRNSGVRTSTSSWCASAVSLQAEFPQILIHSDFHQPAGIRSRSRTAHAGAFQHCQKRGAGARGHLGHPRNTAQDADSPRHYAGQAPAPPGARAFGRGQRPRNS
jgi:hypothetical protein